MNLLFLLIFPLFSYRLKNGKPVEVDGSNLKEIKTDDGKVVLQIAEATDDDAGSYTAIAANELGQTESSADLAVLGIFPVFVFSFKKPEN